MITLTALTIALALGWTVRTAWRALARLATPPAGAVAAVAVEDPAR